MNLDKAIKFIGNQVYEKQIYLLFLLALVSLSGIVILNNRSAKNYLISHKIESFNNFREVKADFNESNQIGISGTNDGNSALHDTNGQGMYFMCGMENCSAEYKFSKKFKLKKISLLFIGTLETNKNISFDYGDNQIKNEDIIYNCNKSNVCDFYFTKSIDTKKLIVSLKHATYKHFGIREIKFYKSSKNSFIVSVFNVIFIWNRNLLTYLAYPVLFFLIFLIPGTAIGEFLLKKRRMKIDILQTLLISAAAISLIFWLSSPIIKILIILEFILLAYFLFKKTGFLQNLIQDNKIILSIFLVSTVAISFLMFIRDFPKNKETISNFDFYSNYTAGTYGSYETDFLIPFQSAINYQKGGEALQEKVGGIYNITDRTPLMSFIYMVYGKAFGLNEFTYQMVVAFLGSLFIIAAYSLSSLFLDKFQSYLISLLLGLSQFFIFTTLFGPAKTVTLFFILSSIYYLLKANPNYFLSGIFIAIAYLFHPFALVYFISFFLFIVLKLFKNMENKTNLIKTITYFSVPLVIALVLWTAFSFYLGQNSSIYSSVITEDTWKNASENIRMNKSSYAISVFLEKNYWVNKFYNSLSLFVFSFNKYPEPMLFDYFKTTIPGATGLITFVFLAVGAIGRIYKKEKANKDIFKIAAFFIFLPMFLSVMYQGFFLRMGLLWYTLGVIPFIMIILGMLYKNKRLFGAIICLALSENFYLFFVYDKINYGRITDFFGDEGIFLWLIYIFLISIYFIFIKSILNEHRRT